MALSNHNNSLERSQGEGHHCEPFRRQTCSIFRQSCEIGTSTAPRFQVRTSGTTKVNLGHHHEEENGPELGPHACL